MNIPYLSDSELNALGLTTNDVINSIEHVIRGREKGKVWSAPKAVVTPPQDQRYMMAALAAMDNPSMLAVKTVVLNPENTKNGLPQINGLVTLLESNTGLPLAILDGNWITATRTAGLSAVAAQYMAKRTSKTLGFVGCGVQARSHLTALAQIFPLKHVKFFGRGQENKDKLKEAVLKLALTSEECSTGQAAIENIDLVVTTVTHTGKAKPFLDARGLAKGACVMAVDLGAPWHQESFAHLDRVVVDDLVQEKTLPNKLCDPAIIKGDLSGLVLGKANGRRNNKEKTLFIFRGHALGDLGVSVLALQRYQRNK